jgi:hypothetical protein
MWKKKAIGKIGTIFEPHRIQGLARDIERTAPLAGSESVFRHIAEATEREAILDHLAAIRFAVTFAELKFEATFEPCGGKGPDLLVLRDDQSSYVEVRRFRPSRRQTDLPCLLTVSEAAEDEELVRYGNFEMDVKKIEDELSNKFRQVEVGTSIVAFWSDRFEDIDFELAIEHLRTDSANGIKRVPSGLLFCIFASDWSSSGGLQLRCGALKPLAEPFATWAKELESARF